MLKTNHTIRSLELGELVVFGYNDLVFIRGKSTGPSSRGNYPRSIGSQTDESWWQAGECSAGYNLGQIDLLLIFPLKYD